MKNSRIGFDIGGTFTDVILFDEGEGIYYSVKTSSTPKDQSIGATTGIKKILERNEKSGESVSYLSHGTTVGTNAILEGKLAKTALIATKGFRDVLEIGRQRRPQQYSFFAEKARVLIPREFRFVVKERVNFKGEIVDGIDEQEVREIVRILKEKKVGSIAVSFLFSFLNNEHENTVKKLIEESYPGVYVFLSSEILPEYREYERTSTVSLNAAVAPVVSRYVENLEKKIHDALGIDCGMNLMKSSGGLMPSIQVHTRAVETVLSGPAAGAIGVSYFGNIAGYDNLIGFDMGGTSTDISVIVNGKPRVTSEGAIGGYPFALPIVDINTIGAGGGSIAWIDVAQGLHVGPESAGADPGPICYSKGGSNPTITDANLCLGRLNNTYFLGGEMEVDKTASEKEILENIGKPLGKDLAEACQGILDVANANMIRVIRVSSMEKGLDPRNFALMAFGGSGPVHAADVAEELSIGTVIIPSEAGLLSAKGLLVTDHKNDYSMTRISRFRKTDKSDLISIFEELRLKAIADFEKDKMPTENIYFICSMDLRYTGQAYEINIPIIGEISDNSFDKLEKDFNETHKRLYWWNDPERMLEIVNLRISAISEVPKVKPQADKIRGKDSHHAVKETRPVYFKELGGFDDTRIYARDQLQTGNEVGGPAVIESFDTTVIILPNHKAIIDAFGNIIIRTRSYLNE